MKLFHISDLHIGKQLHLYDLADVQRSMLHQIVERAIEERPDAILIAGDIYDRSAPSGEAYQIFDTFLNELAHIEPMIPVLIIAGNHDNHLRLGYASEFLEKQGIYISAALPLTEEEYLKKVTLQDAEGEVDFYLMPFVKPADARNLMGDSVSIQTYDDAVSAILGREELDLSKRNVLVAHQFFVSGNAEPERRESEVRYISVGGIDSVDVQHVALFDYVALGHIHSSQQIGSPSVRYSGSPLKYSVSEANDEKSITCIQLGKKASEPDITTLPLSMKPDVRRLRGTLQEVIAMADEEKKDDFVSIVLTDAQTLFRPKDRLADFYSRIIDVTIDNARTAALLHHDAETTEKQNPLKMFSDFYQEMNDQPMSDEEQNIMMGIIEKVLAKYM